MYIEANRQGYNPDLLPADMSQRWRTDDGPQTEGLYVVDAMFSNRRFGSQIIKIIGTEHTHNTDIQSSQLMARCMRDEWEDWISSSRARLRFPLYEFALPAPPRIVLTEGRVHQISANDDELSCLKHERGESRLTALWATREGIPLYLMEPDIAILAAKLLRSPNFGHEEIAYYLWSRQQAQGIAAGKDITAHMRETLQYLQQYIGWIEAWHNFDFSLENIINIHNRLFPNHPFDPYDSPFFLEQTTDLSRHDTPIQEVSLAWNTEREHEFYIRLRMLAQHSDVLFVCHEKHARALQKVYDIGRVKGHRA